MPRRTHLASLVVLGCLFTLSNAVGLLLQRDRNLVGFIGAALTQGAIYFGGVWLILTRRIPRSLLVVLLFAVVCRITVLFAPPFLSTDVYRYVWDGRVQAAGTNPYRFVPESPELESLQDDKVFPRINRRQYAPTIYPPLAQAIFLAATRFSESITWIKTVMLCFEAVTIWLLIRLLISLGLPAERVLIYAWNPLSIWEFADSGHIDAAAIAFLVISLWARRRDRPALTGLALGCAALTKFYPAAIFPALYRRWDWKMPAAFAATLILGYLPYAAAGSRLLGFLPGYVEEEGLKSGERFYLLKLLQNTWPSPSFDGVTYLAICGLVLLAIAVWTSFRNHHEQSFLLRAAILACCATVLFSPHYPWYFAWVLPLLAFFPYPPMLYLTVASFMLYETLLGETPEAVYSINTRLYVPFLILIAVHALWKRLLSTRNYAPES
jgi:hypothetical protein